MVQLRLHQVVHPQSLSKHWLRTLSHHHSPSRKAFVSDAASWNALRKDLQTEQIQWPRALVVRSFSENPYVNLAIENYLLGYSHPESRIYFFYVNRPCIVIGRNQNPWLEVNLQKLREHSFPVDLVRRRSGGGAVFHDYGNLNYCAIVPSNVFTRDLHAQALADGLNKAAIDKVAGSFSVNDRHDVVLCAENGPQPLKVSGSAYKLTKGRALHHGTCLVASPNLSQISQYLRSPSRPFIRAKGVESVSSKIGNVSSLSFDFLEESKMLGVVMDDLMYSFVDSAMHPANKPGVDNDLLYHWINDPECLDTREHNGLREVIDKIFADAAELKARSWKYLQTPRFTFASHPEPRPETEDGTSSSSSKKSAATDALPDGFPQDERVHLHVKSGVIEGSNVTCLRPDISLKGRSLHEIRDWRDFIANEIVATWMNKTLLCPEE